MKEKNLKPMTVREWMAVDEIEEMSLMTGSGQIHLTRAEFPKVLAGESVAGHLGWVGTEHEIRPDEFLDEIVTSPYVEDGILYGIS